MHMDAFMKNGPKFDSTMAASFIRFLTRQDGSNISAGMGCKLKVLETKLTKQIKDIETSASAKGQKTLNKLATLYMKNPTLVKPQSDGRNGVP